MIEINELRTNNVLTYMTADGDIMPTHIDYQDLEWITNDSYEFNSCHAPIILNADWLKKLGFKGRVDFVWNGIVGIQVRDVKYYLALKDFRNVLFHSVVEVKYVHQLQNLYYFLTGLELHTGREGIKN